MSEDEAESIAETLDIMSNPELMRDIREALSEERSGWEVLGKEEALRLITRRTDSSP